MLLIPVYPAYVGGNMPCKICAGQEKRIASYCALILSDQQ